MGRHSFGNTTSPTSRRGDRRTVVDQRAAIDQKAPGRGNEMPPPNRWGSLWDTVEIVSFLVEVLLTFVP